ncbi:TerD family protein [Streptacidiphilus carbonis]|uniref:TerD family protein n=1 Tax=Streptacidiphilus carbonis TaxID=105422 RepID=UPI0005A9CE05|nr:TerD family protein [Streptacidiphilus carbonis]
MTKVMPKGSNTPLTKVDAVRAVLRWRLVPGAPDVDVSALLLGPDGRVSSDDDFVFYNQPRHPSGLVRHRSRARIGDDVTETVDIDLALLPTEIDRVVVGGSVEHGDFDEIPELRILLFDIALGPGAEALARFDIADTGGVTALLCGELYRRSGGWKFRAIGQGYSSGLVGLATDFGITIDEDEDDDEPAAPAPAPEPTPEPELVIPPPPSHPPTPPAPQPAVEPAAAAASHGYGYPPPYQPAQPVQPALLPEPEGFALPLQGPQFQGGQR